MMSSRFLTLKSAIPSLIGVAGCLSVPTAAAPQEQATGDLVFSVERISKELKRTPSLQVTLDQQRPVSVATFRVAVEQREFMLPFKEQLQKEFALTDFQRQSQDWAVKCYGLNVIQLTKSLDRAMRRYETRKIRKQIARELAQLAAASKK